MRNRAKCKLCKSVIESLHQTDLIMCLCGEIFVDGGSSMKCGCTDWSNFLRIDDQDNEIIVKVKDAPRSNSVDDISTKPTKKDLINMLDEMVKNIENLPDHAMSLPINHYDYCSLLILLSGIFKEDD